MAVLSLGSILILRINHNVETVMKKNDNKIVVEDFNQDETILLLKLITYINYMQLHVINYI